MNKLIISYPRGATPINPDEAMDLIPDYISTMGELNQLEQSNIADGFVWAGKQSLNNLLTASFLLELHEKMFNQVWKWAGKTRRSNKNIGVAKESIMNDLAVLLGDTKYWISQKTYSNDEIAARFHHRLVQIHIFPNGNGRHARLTTDLLMKSIGGSKPTWGSSTDQLPIDVEGITRSNYIMALKKADENEFEDLIKFLKS